MYAILIGNKLSIYKSERDARFIQWIVATSLVPVDCWQWS